MAVEIIRKVLDWSEVWALFIPLFFLFRFKKQSRYLTPVIVYLFLALLLNCLIDIGYIYQGKVGRWLHPNNYLYNIHSIARFVCFTYFFLFLDHPYRTLIKKILPYVYFLVAINFAFVESFVREKSFSSNLLSAEAGLLLFYCLQYYLYKLKEDNFEIRKQQDFWIVTGLSIYVVFNFPYFLFYTYLLEKEEVKFVVQMWYFHNVTFIILCIFIAKAFYVPPDDRA